MEISGLDFKIKEMASRIRELREIEGISPEQMALSTVKQLVLLRMMAYDGNKIIVI